MPKRSRVPPPTLDDHPGFFQRVEDFSIEQFIAELTSVTPSRLLSQEKVDSRKKRSFNLCEHIFFLRVKSHNLARG
jgi:hypothetical protein